MQATRNLILYPNLVLVPSENRILIGTSLAISSREPRLLQSVFNKALLRLDPQEKERILLKNEIRTPPHRRCPARRARSLQIQVPDRSADRSLQQDRHA